MSDKVEIVGRTAKVDGRSSDDPDGSLLTYKWRLREAPDESDGTLYTDDGTCPTSTDTLENLTSTVGVAVGDYLKFDSTLYEITGVGANDVTVDGTPFTIGTTDLIARIYKSSYISYASMSVATIHIDVLGQYLVQLEVYDGLLWSEPVDILIDGREWDSILGEAIDGEYMWSYISDAYSVVNEREYITEFFAGMTQIAGNTAIKAFQTETGASLGNIQPYFYYRWLRINNFVEESDLTNQSFVPAYGEITDNMGAAPTPPSAGDTLELRLYTGEDVYTDITYTFVGPADVPATVTELNVFFLSLGYPLTADSFDWGGDTFISLKGDVAFEVLSVSGADPVFVAGQTNWLFGDTGVKISKSLYRIGGSSLQTLRNFSLEGHFLVMRGESYKILSVEEDASDTLPGLRLNLDRELPALDPADLNVWAIPGYFESSTTDWENELVFNADMVHLTLSYTDSDGIFREEESTSRVVGAHGKKIGVFTSFPTNPYYDRVLAYKVKRYGYQPLDDTVHRIPKLQEIINDPPEIIQENIEYLIDYYRGRRCIIYDYFNPRDYTGSTSPIVPISIEDDIADDMWAEHVIVSNRDTIDKNFGAQVFFDEETYSGLDDASYLASVRGLWFIFSRGKTIENLRRGMYVFFALPFAEQDGTIEQIAYSGDSPYGRIYVRDDEDPNELRTYLFKKSLGLGINQTTGNFFAVGDHVDQFTPLVQGIDVLDWIKDPSWFAGKLGTGHFMDDEFYEVQKYHRFVIEIDSQAYTVDYKDAAQEFVDEWRPRYLLPVFVIIHKVTDDITLTDFISWDVTLHLIDTFCPSVPYLFDTEMDFDSAGHPIPPSGVTWNFDDVQFCPRDIISVSYTWSGPSGWASYRPFPTGASGVGSFDTIFSFDSFTSISGATGPKGPALYFDASTWSGVFPYSTGWITIYPWRG